jgi:peptidoglycan/LPS O-acetylase OafA/YrhL
MKYRAEIDGLRALAVVPVVFFHAGFEPFSAGFIGVDIFFVISGYLITSLLIADLKNGCLSLSDFYERRARRLLPALFLVMTVCIPFSWVLMSPNQMKDFCQSLVAVSVFSANILFYEESGYFDALSEEKPLLHTWSLAVEEQYYLIFPVLLLITWRSSETRALWVLILLSSISFGLSEWAWRNQPSMNFYFIFTRAWEIFAGSLAAFVVQQRGVKANNTLSVIGIFLIALAFIVYDDTTPFPSVFTLVPVIGVVLLIMYAEKKTFVAQILGSKLFVGVGLISYSAYLWHQPLFAFARIKLHEAPSVLSMLMLSLLSFVLAYLSWHLLRNRFVEKVIC